MTEELLFVIMWNRKHAELKLKGENDENTKRRDLKPFEYRFKSRISLVSVRVTVLRLPLETAIFVMRIPILFQIS